MALKRKITVEQFEKLSADLKAEYVKDGEGYALDVDGDTSAEDNAALRRAKDREVADRKTAQAEAKEAKDKLALLENDDARKNGDIDKLQTQWDAKAAETKATNDTTIAGKDKFISQMLRDNVAQQIAAEISTSPAIILPHIKSRLSVTGLDTDTPTTQVLDTDGKPSVMKIDELKKEFVDNKDFASIIQGSKATGGGAPDKSQRTRLSSATQNPNGDDKPAMLSQISPKDLAAQLTAAKAADG